MRRQLSVTIIGGLVLLCICLLPISTVSVGAAGDTSRKAAPNFTVNDSKGAPVSLADYKGKVVLLNFWATWCHGCVEEMPWFMEFQDKYRAKGLAVIGVSMDDDGWKSVTPFVEEKKVNYRVVIDDKKVSAEFGLGAMPMTVLIDRNGRIANNYEGVVDREACEKQIRALLEEKNASSAD